MGAVLLAALAMVVVSHAPEQSSAPGDREIRVSHTGNLVTTTLTLMLKGASGPLPINLVLTARRDSARPEKAPAFEMEFRLPLYVGQLDFQLPHYQLITGDGTEHEVIVEGSVPGNELVESITLVYAPFDLVRLSQLSRAKAAQGRLFGIVFVLTAEQMTAIGDFSVRALGQ